MAQFISSPFRRDKHRWLAGLVRQLALRFSWTASQDRLFAWLTGRCSCLARAKPVCREIRWHDLRHTFASVMKGVDIRTVQELMGHKTIQMTLRYAHLAPVHQLEAVQRLCDSRTLETKRWSVGQNERTDTKTSTDDSRASTAHAEHLQ